MFNSNEVLMGNVGEQFEGGQYQTITFCVTEECNLRCKYCYMYHKNNFRRMSFEIAKKSVDYILSTPPRYPSVVWEFIGGEPTLEVELIDKICDYIKMKTYELKHPWFDSYMFQIGTNGVLYDNESFQKFIQKNYTHLSMGITIDGTKEKHDLNRVKIDGSGSYDDVIKNVPLWLSQFPNATTKVTFASADLKYLKDSIVHLWDNGLRLVPANVVFEDVWSDGDDLEYERQLKMLADYVIENELWNEYSVRFFDPAIGHPMGRKEKQSNFCGTGKMLAIDCDGVFYPCIRFLDFCIPDSTTSGMTIGNVDDGIDKNKLAIFENLSMDILNDNECASCPIASGCFTCAGNNYATSETHTVYKRTKFHCEMHKAQVRASEYFWDRYIEKTNCPSQFEKYRMHTFSASSWDLDGAKFLYFILNDHVPPYCMYSSQNISEQPNIMPQDVFDKGIDYAYSNHMVPVFVGDPSGYLSDFYKNKFHVRFDIGIHSPISEVEKYMPILNSHVLTEINLDGVYGDSCLLLVSPDSFSNISADIRLLLKHFKRVNLIKQDLLNWKTEDIENYGDALEKISSWMTEHKVDANRINVLAKSTDGDKRAHNWCRAGISDFAISPTGKFYFCPAFYFNNLEDIGTVDDGLNIKDPEILSLDKAPKCNCCSNENCSRCIFINKMNVDVINVPSKTVCQVAEVEIRATPHDSPQK